MNCVISQNIHTTQVNDIHMTQVMYMILLTSSLLERSHSFFLFWISSRQLFDSRYFSRVGNRSWWLILTKSTLWDYWGMKEVWLWNKSCQTLLSQKQFKLLIPPNDIVSCFFVVIHISILRTNQTSYFFDVFGEQVL